MLALFGQVPDRLHAAYAERHPLDAGWRDRVEFWQLYPLLVHAVLFGASYRASALSVARHYGSSGAGYRPTELTRRGSWGGWATVEAVFLHRNPKKCPTR